jgi:hypothetical protein
MTGVIGYVVILLGWAAVAVGAVALVVSMLLAIRHHTFRNRGVLVSFAVFVAMLALVWITGAYLATLN